MARGVNRVILIGNCCADPELRYMPNGGAVVNVTIATNEQWVDKASGERKERAEFHRIVMFNKLAEIAGEYLKKGSKVYVEGSLRTRQWEKDGQKHYTTEIVASEMQMLDSRGAGGEREGAPDRGGYQAPFSPQKTADPDAPDAPVDNFDDDIPF